MVGYEVYISTAMGGQFEVLTSPVEKSQEALTGFGGCCSAVFSMLDGSGGADACSDTRLAWPRFWAKAANA